MPAPIDLNRDLIEYATMIEWRGPTVRQWQEARGFSSTSVANYHLRALERAGYLVRMGPRGQSASPRPLKLSHRGVQHLAYLGIDIVGLLTEDVKA